MSLFPLSSPPQFAPDHPPPKPQFRPLPSPQNLSFLIKSRSCLQKLTSRISTCKKQNTSNKTLKSIEQTAKELTDTIDAHLEQNFLHIINDHDRLKMTSANNFEIKDRKNATQQLMKDYWNKKQNSIPNHHKSKEKNYSQNTLPKISNKLLRPLAQNNTNRTDKKLLKGINFNIQIYQKQKIINNKPQIPIQNNINRIQVINYQIQNDTEQFIRFQKNHYTKLDQLQYILNKVQNFTQRYQLKLCTVNLQKIIQLIDTKTHTLKFIKPVHLDKNNPTITKNIIGNEKEYSLHEILGCLENSQEISENNNNKAGIRFYGKCGKVRAVTKIQAVWRGKLVFDKVKKLRQTVKKAIKIQRAYKIYKNYQKTKQIINKNCTQKYQWFTKKQQQFRQNYRINELSKKIKYEIHICWDSQNQWQTLSTQNFIQKQNYYLTRIFRAFQQNSVIQTRIILVTLYPLSSQILNYYYKLLELGGATQYKNKVIFMSPTQCSILQDKLSLPRLLYYFPSVLTKIKSTINKNYAYIIPSTPSIDYIHISHFLNLPLYSSSPQELLHLQTKSGCKTFLESLNNNSLSFSIVPYAINIYSVKYFISQMTVLILAHPYVKKWVLKIDNQENSRGLAFVEVSKLIPKKMLRHIRNIYNQFAPNSTKNSVIPELNSLTEQLFNVVSETFSHGQKISIVNKSVYRNQAEYLTSYFVNGGIIQAEVGSSEQSIQNLCWCVDIQPDSQWRMICSYKKIAIKKRTVCCYFSSQVAQVPQQVESIAKQLISKKYFGFFIVEFIKHCGKQNGKQPKMYINSIKCNLDVWSSSSFLRQFISKPSNALYIPYIAHPNIKKITLPTFFHLCRLQNISFDIERKIGNIFMFLDGLQSGCIGLMAFNRSSKIQTFIHVAQFLDFLNNRVNTSAKWIPGEQFLMIRNAINGYLNLQKKNRNMVQIKDKNNIRKGENNIRNKKYLEL